MKIVQIFPGKVWGGAEQYVLDLGRALQARGHEVEWLCLEVEAVTSRLRAEQIPFQTIKRITPALIDGADIVHIHDSRFVSPAVKAARRCRQQPKVIFTRHIARASRVLPWCRSAWRRLDAIIFVSELARSMWSGVNSWFDPERAVVIHNSIPPQEGAAPTDTLYNIRSRFEIPSATPLLMFTGRVRRSKGCETIIEALAPLSKQEFAMIFVGTPKPADYDHRLIALARRLGIADRIHFTGFTPSARDLVAQATIGLQPSIVREAFGLSQLEFMQAGKPLITTDNGAQPEYVSDGVTGLLVPPANPARLSEAIARLLDDPALRASLGQAAADSYRTRLSYPLFIDRIINVYTQAISRP